MKIKRGLCLYCNNGYPLTHPNKQYCNRICKNRGINKRRREDPVYRLKQKKYYQNFKLKNPDYMINWFLEHPDYMTGWSLKHPEYWKYRRQKGKTINET